MSNAFNGALSVVITDAFKCSQLHCGSIKYACSIDSACKVIVKGSNLTPDSVLDLVLIAVGIVEIIYVFTVVSIIGLLRQGGGTAAALNDIWVTHLFCPSQKRII